VFPQVRGSLQRIPFEAHAGFTFFGYTCRIVSEFSVKAFFDKASGTAYREPGLREGLRILAAVAAGVNGIFVEVHDAPEKALSDGANALRISLLGAFWGRLKAIHALVA
jgi:3-deoxy-D-manno-octulosonic acid (KDO) 8-phosphate synthase